MILNLGDGFALRRATEADHAALSLVCLRTGNAGQDATGREDDPALLGLIFAIPYRVLEPDLAFALDGPDGICGYVLGARDTMSFNARLAAEWYPLLRLRTPDPGSDEAQWHGSDPWRHFIHHPDFEMAASLAPYPSHGHIDLLPEARGRGIGRRMMTVMQDRLAAAGSPGMHLQVDPANSGAIAFYKAVGFVALQVPEGPGEPLTMVKRLSAR